MGYINNNVPGDARVIVRGSVASFWASARPDLDVISQEELGTQVGTFYALMSLRYDNDVDVYPDSLVLYRVGQAGVTLAVLKQGEIAYP